MDTLILEVGGRLTSYTHDEKVLDVTESAPTLLFEPCLLAHKVTLRDIFLLLERHIDVFDKLLGNWCKVFTEEALSNKEGVALDVAFDYLELYHVLEVDDEELLGMDRPDFHAVQGEESYSLSFLPVHEYVDYPLVLGKTQMDDGKTFYETPFTLGKILYGILWEISFYGPPISRDQKGKELKDSMNELRLKDLKDFKNFFDDEDE
jgi:hypothetical protein